MREFILMLFAQILSASTPVMREELVKFVNDFRDSAKKTPNPWDDILANMLAWIVGVT